MIEVQTKADGTLIKSKDRHADEEDQQSTILNWEFAKVPLNEASNGAKEASDEPDVKHHLSNGKDIYENSLDEILDPLSPSLN